MKTPEDQKTGALRLCALPRLDAGEGWSFLVLTSCVVALSWASLFVALLSSLY